MSVIARHKGKAIQEMIVDKQRSKKMADIFISKSTRDDELALSICDILEQNGVDCWISNRDLKTTPRKLYAIDIVNAILVLKAVLLILSYNSNKSRHVINEINTACDNGKKCLFCK